MLDQHLESNPSALNNNKFRLRKQATKLSILILDLSRANNSSGCGQLFLMYQLWSKLWWLFLAGLIEQLKKMMKIRIVEKVKKSPSEFKR